MFYDLPAVEQEFHHAEWLRKHDECPHHPGPREECADPEKDWFPQRHICHAAMEQASAERKYARIHKDLEYHDGTFTSWAEKASDSHPFHFNDGVTIYVTPTDENPHDHFLGGAETCDECREAVNDGNTP